MTREEAIYWLDHGDLDRTKFYTAVGYAIEALKAQSEHPDTNVEETTFKPGDRFILELGKEYLDEFEIKGADLCIKIELLKMLTPYEPEQKTGRWIYDGEYKNGMMRMKCSNCKTVIETFDSQSRLRYCQNCGAKMEEQE